MRYARRGSDVLRVMRSPYCQPGALGRVAWCPGWATRTSFSEAIAACCVAGAIANVVGVEYVTWLGPLVPRMRPGYSGWPNCLL